jgi:hypothetical protein
MPRFFQHINPDSPEFEKVTTLNYIDDSDPDITLYVFHDGTKCNKELIAPINDPNAFRMKKIMAELSDDINKWHFHKIEIKRNIQSAVSADGTTYEVPDAYMGEDMKDHVKWDANPPLKVNINNIESDEDYIKHDNHENISNSTSKTVNTSPAVTEPMTINNMVNSTTIKMPVPVIAFDNNMQYSIDIDGQMLQLPGNIIKERLLSGKQPTLSIPSNNENLISTCTSEEKGLVDNMIKMSKKDEGEIEIAVTLNLPAKDVFTLLTTVYPAKMADEFIVNIANSISIHDLRISVANGLEEYYGAENIEDSEIVEVENEQPTVDIYQYKAESVAGQVYRSTRSANNTETSQNNENKKPRTKRYK